MRKTDANIDESHGIGRSVLCEQWEQKAQGTGNTKFTAALVISWLVLVLGVAMVALGAGCDGQVQAETASETITDGGIDMNLVTSDADQGTIGQSAKDVPAANTAAKGQAGLGPITGILQFKGNTQDPQMLTTSIFAEDPGNAGLLYGPLTGILQWGAGNSDTHVAEIDVQSDAGFGASVGLLGGVIASVPASSLQVSVRNDGNFIPALGNIAIGQARTGRASALVSVGSRSSSGDLHRTIWAVLGSAGNGLAAAGTAAIIVPPYASGVRVFRSNGTAMTVSLVLTAGGGLTIDTITVAANTPCPFIPIGNQVLAVSVTNTGPAEITALYGLYDIQL